MVPVLGTRFVTLSVLVVLVAPALTLLAPAEAQAPAASSGNLVITDPVGDVGPFGVGGLPETPASAAYGHVDITRLEIGNDDPQSFDLILGVAGFGDPTQVVTTALALTDFRCSLEWTYVNDDDDLRYTYTVDFYSTELVPGSGPGQPTLDWYWWYFDGEGSRGQGSWGGDWPGTITYGETDSAFVIKMPKSWAPVWPGGHNPGFGDVLLMEYATCSADVLAYGRVSDSVEVSETSRYAFKSGGSRSSVLHVGFSAPDGDGVGADPMTWQPPTSDQFSSQVSSVAPDGPTKIPVYVSNQADSRKLVQLSVAFEDPAASTGWNLSVTPSIMVPANDMRTVNLIVIPPAGASLGAALPIRVTAQATGEPIDAVGTTTLRVTPLLSAENNKFYLHTRTMAASSHPLNAVVAEVSPFHALRASLLEIEPGYDDGPAPLGMRGGLYASQFFDPLVRPLRLDTQEPVRIAVAFEGESTKTVDVEMYLMANDEAVFAIRQNVPGDGVTEIEAIIAGEGSLEFDVGTEFYFEMNVVTAGIGPQTVQDTSFLAKQSHFILPVLPGGADYTLTDGRFLPSLALAKDEEASTYLNPGKEYAFDLVLSNEGIETDDLRLSVNATNATGWDVAIMPGSTFRVNPGNSTPFALVVNAPADAAEGQRAVFDVTAQSKHDPRVRTQLRIDVIVTTGLELEGKPYEEKDGQLPPLEEEHENAPGLHLLTVVAAMAAVAVLRRRRS